MAPAGQKLSPGGSPRSPGAPLVVKLVELGRLSAHTEEEILIIEASPATGCVAMPGSSELVIDGFWEAPLSSSSPARLITEEDDAEWEPTVEADLTVEDFDLEQQEESWRDLSTGMPDLWAPGSAKGRSLMVARAKQCVICMENKEHTLVPPHKGHCNGMNLEGHRLCTDCWEELLQHGLDRHWDWQHGRRGPSPALTCPVCRIGVEVPDAWDVEQELPEGWVQRPPARPTGCCPLGEHTAAQPEPVPKWADAAGGLVAKVGAAPPAVGSGPAAAPGGLLPPCIPARGSWSWFCCAPCAGGGEELVVELAEAAEPPVLPL